MAVTGAAGGIGRGCAELLAREGASVVVADVREKEGAAVAEGICDAGGASRFVRTDVLQEDQCAALIQESVRCFGRLDALVNNVGWFPRAALEETTATLWDDVLALNLRSAFFCCKHAVPQLRAGGGGSIVNMGSAHGVQGIPTLVAYSAAKGGLLTLTRTLAGALARDRIRVNYVIPGWVLTDTEMALQQSLGASAEEVRASGTMLPLGRHQTVEDAAFAVLYLVSDESTQVTGAVLNVDAGISQLPVYRESSHLI